jgi:hypothetical protein
MKDTRTGTEEPNIFEDGKEAILDQVCMEYLVLKQKFIEQKIPPNEKFYQQYFLKEYFREIEMEEMMQIREFIESGDYGYWKEGRILQDRENGATAVDMRRFFE